jgi:hypothetical protein
MTERRSEAAWGWPDVASGIVARRLRLHDEPGQNGEHEVRAAREPAVFSMQLSSMPPRRGDRDGC